MALPGKVTIASSHARPWDIYPGDPAWGLIKVLWAKHYRPSAILLPTKTIVTGGYSDGGDHRNLSDTQRIRLMDCIQELTESGIWVSGEGEKETMTGGTSRLPDQEGQPVEVALG